MILRRKEKMFAYKGVMFGSLALTLAAALTACTSDGNEETSSAVAADWRTLFQSERIKADVEFLADDALKGRDTGSEGHVIAANYVAAQFKRLGLKPAGDDGSYFQQVPFHKVSLDTENSGVTVTIDGAERALKAGDEFAIGANVVAPNMAGGGDLVFVGYGVHAPEVGVDELEGLDLNGKIAVAFGGAPETLHTEIRAHYGRTGKLSPLLEKGVKGVLLINSPAREARWNADAIRGAMQRPRMSWIGNEETDRSVSGALTASITHDVARELFKGAEKSFDEVLEDFENKTMTGFALKSSAKIMRSGEIVEEFQSPNVVAVLEGSDPALKDEYVVTSAHLDHIGISTDEDQEDRINNGAMDNATGVSILLEVARNYIEQGIKPKRSILFITVTAEEKGLLGAEYFAHYPTVEKSALVANVNLDMPVLLYDFVDVIAFGADRSSLGPITRSAVAKADVSLTPDPLPEQSLFVRSDHYRFVQQGIPAVFLMTGFKDTPDGENGGEIFKEFLSTKYHTHADEPELPIRYDAGAKFAYVNFLILKEIADGDVRPSWNEGDFFGNLFGQK